MKPLLTIIIAFICCNSLKAQIIPAWATTYVVNYPESINGSDMVTDKNGNVYITGYKTDTSHVVTVVTLKYNSAGQMQWVQQYDSIGYFTRIAVDIMGNVYISGQSSNNLLTLKYNTQGVFQWVRSYSGSLFFNWAFDIATDDSCNVYITGNSNGNKFTTLKYNTFGTLMWYALDGPALGLTNSYMTLDNNKNVYITARGEDTINTSSTCNTIKYNSAGIKQWESIYTSNFNPGLSTPRGLKFDPSGFVYLLAATTNNNNGDGDYALVKYDTLGNQKWISTYSFSNHYDTPKSMVIDKTGNVYITGSIYQTGGTIDSIATIKINASGIFKWRKTYSLGYHSNDEATDIAIDSLGYIYVAGMSSDNSNKENFATIKYDH